MPVTSNTIRRSSELAGVAVILAVLSITTRVPLGPTPNRTLVS